MVADCTTENQLVPECTELCQCGPSGTSVIPRLGNNSLECQILSESCPNVPNSAHRQQEESVGFRGYPRVSNVTSDFRLVPERAELCQSGPIETVRPQELSNSIMVTISIEGIGVQGLIATGSKISFCRWGWYKKWQYRLGEREKSRDNIVGIGNNPLRTKGITRPLTLLWDGVKGQCQLTILTGAYDVDGLIGADILAQFQAQINVRERIAWPGK